MMHESDKSGDKVRGDGTQGYILKSRAARGLILGIESILDDLIEMIILAQVRHGSDEFVDFWC